VKGISRSEATPCRPPGSDLRRWTSGLRGTDKPGPSLSSDVTLAGQRRGSGAARARRVEVSGASVLAGLPPPRGHTPRPAGSRCRALEQRVGEARDAVRCWDGVAAGEQPSTARLTLPRLIPTACSVHWSCSAVGLRARASAIRCSLMDSARQLARSSSLDRSSTASSAAGKVLSSTSPPGVCAARAVGEQRGALGWPRANSTSGASAVPAERLVCSKRLSMLEAEPPHLR